MRALRLPALALLAAAASGPAAAQTGAFGALSQDARAEVRDARVLGAGGAAAAVPDADLGFFYNPALLGRADLRRPTLHLATVRAGAETDLADKVRFIDTRLRPELEDGGLVTKDPATMTPDEADRLHALYDETMAVFGDQTVVDAEAAGPSLAVGLPMGGGGQLGLGVGVFAATRARAQTVRGGAGIPYLDLYSQADVLVPVSAGLRLPGLPLSVGATATYVDRRIAARGGSIETFADEDAKLYVLHGTTVAVDLGAHLADVAPIPGRLDLGLALYQVAGGDYTFEQDAVLHDGSFSPRGRDDLPDDPAEVQALIDRFSARRAGRSFRAGAAYALPHVPGLDVTLAADYVSASTAEVEQPALAKVRAGATARLGGVLDLRAGLSQGYPTAGVGLRTRLLRLDYAFYGVEDGRLPGQTARYNHLVQVSLGWF